MSRSKAKSIKFGDSRVFFESTITETFNSPAGITYEPGSVVRGSAFIGIGGKKDVSITLPSMAELIFYQSQKQLEKATSIKKRALRVEELNGHHRLVDEEAFYTYMQLLSLGLLGLYAALEGMVYELYIRRYKEKPVILKGVELTHEEFTRKGFEAKLTTISSQLSGCKNIYGTELHEYAKEIHKLRSLIQHWNLERRDDYFINLPENHPLKVFPNTDPMRICGNARKILDHYSLKPNNS